MVTDIASIVDGRELVKQALDGNPAPIIERLRSDYDLTQEERVWLADLLEKKPEAKQKRGRKKQKYQMRNWALRDAFDWLENSHDGVSNDAIYQDLAERIFPNESGEQKAAEKIRKRLSATPDLPNVFKLIACGLHDVDKPKPLLLRCGDPENIWKLLDKN